MRRIITISVLWIAVIGAAWGQNEIDYIDSYYRSGFGQPAFDGDTLYLNSLDRNGVERYDVSDLANPILIDHQARVGFDIIDFERRLMIKIDDTIIRFYGFSDFGNLSRFEPLELPAATMDNAVKIAGDYLLAACADDSIRTYDISDLEDIELAATAPFLVGELSEDILGTMWAFTVTAESPGGVINKYDIHDPLNVVYEDSLRFPYINFSNEYSPCNGDTIAYINYNIPFDMVYFIWYTADSSINIFSITGSPNLMDYQSSKNSFLLSFWYSHDELYDKGNFEFVGIVYRGLNYDLYLFDIFSVNHMLRVFPNRFEVLSAADTINYMEEIYTYWPEYQPIMSTARFQDSQTDLDYLLTGAASGETLYPFLLIQEITETGELNLISTLEDILAEEILISGNIAFCLSSPYIKAVDMTSPDQPSVLHSFDIQGARGIARQDSMIYICSFSAIYGLSYNSLTGFSELFEIPNISSELRSICVNQNSLWVLDSAANAIRQFDISNLTEPEEVLVKPLNGAYGKMEFIDNRLWVFSSNGTLILESTGQLDSVEYYGPEYFSDVKEVQWGDDTLYVADGINGLKVFSFLAHPSDSLRLIGRYVTGNSVNSFAASDNNFYLADYYSLQHLRWGVPTGIEFDEKPDGSGAFEMANNYPNPFNANTTIEYHLLNEGKVIIDIYDLQGRRIERVIEDNQTAGKHSLIWDAGEQPSGVYFYRIKAGDNSIVKKMVIIK